MPSFASLVTHWYLHLPSLVLAALIYLVLARLLLSFVLSAENGVMRVLAAITLPVVATVGAITPRIVPPRGVLVASIVWLAAARVVAFWVALAMGMRL
jgi:hypothetical protein